MFKFLALYFRMRVRRLDTWRKVAFSDPFRAHWAIVFRTAPELNAARRWADPLGQIPIGQRTEADFGFEKLGFQTFSGFYNDTVPGGFMTTEDARRIYRNWGDK